MSTERDLLEKSIDALQALVCTGVLNENSTLITRNLISDIKQILSNPEPEPDCWKVVDKTEKIVYLSSSFKGCHKHIDELFEKDESVRLFVKPLYSKPQLTKVEKQRLETLENVCAGLTQDHIDGGFTVKELKRYTKSLEEQLSNIFSAVRDI